MSNRGVKVPYTALKKKKRSVNAMFYYNEIEDSNGVIYSIDMVRMNLEYTKQDTQRLCNWLSKYEDGGNIIINYFESFKFLNYRHLWQIQCKYSDVVNKLCSFSLGMNFNGYKQENEKGFIEFNPNKCMNSKPFREIFEFILNCCWKAEVKRYDLAIDFPTARQNVRLVRDRRKYQLVENKGAVTEYLGIRNEGGFVKLYDKQKESDLNYVLTRLEITLDKEKTLENVFPEVYIVNPQLALNDINNLNKTEMVLLELLQNCDTPDYYMRRLGKTMKNKLKNYLVYDNQFTYNQSIYRMLRVSLENYER